MSEHLWQLYNRLINELEETRHRYLYHSFNVDHRMTGLIGPRGVGKTTLMLQYIKNHLYDQGEAFYFSADNIFFNDARILDFVDNLYQKKGIRYFFIDEIHKYPNWNQELKNIYDSFPKAKIVFSGSSSIDLIQGSYDLSRRAKLLHLPGLSFREYLNLKTGSNIKPIGFQGIVNDHIKLAASMSNITMLLKHFDDYKNFGYYPFILNNENELYQAINDIIDKTIYEDIANFYQLKTQNLIYFKRIINFLATIPPGKINTNNIAQHLRIDHKTVHHYLSILERTGLVRLLFPKAHGNQVLTKFSKAYLNNATLLKAVNTFLSSDLDIGAQRELTFFQFLSGANIPAFYPQKGDFYVNDIHFEIGGKNKAGKQLNAINGEKYAVKDGILVGLKYEIPLYLFGFLY